MNIKFAEGGAVVIIIGGVGGLGGSDFCGTMGSNDFSQAMSSHNEKRIVCNFQNFIFDYPFKGNLKKLNGQYSIGLLLCLSHQYNLWD